MAQPTIQIVPHPERVFTIVVIGAMNPRLHYPMWYQLIGTLSRAESDAARESPAFFINPELSHFQTDDVEIVCTQDRWEVRTTELKARPKILNIACRVFEKLNETPITAYGFNAIQNLVTTAPKVGPVLGRLAIGTGLGFESKNETQVCSFVFSDATGLDARNLRVGPSNLKEEMVEVNYNWNFGLKPQSGYINLTPLISSHFDPHFEAANEFGRSVVNRINAASEVVHAH